MTPKRVLLFSGGLDSFIAWRLLGQPTAAYFRLGHRYQFAEQQALLRLSARVALNVELLDCLSLGHLERPDAYIPQRNLLLAAAAAAHYQPDVVYLGALKGEASRDKSGRFLRETSALLSYTSSRRVEVAAPFRGWTKSRLVREYVRRWPEDAALLSLTRSCYSREWFPEGVVGCGRCVACLKRWVAMSVNGLAERYEYPPWRWEGADLTLGDALGRLLKADPLEWLAILVNNLEALRALRRKRR